MNAIQKRSGQYLGTKIEHKWWRRYSKGGFSTRGIGEYWIKDGSLFFQQHTKRNPIHLPLQSLIEIKICPCKNKTGGMPVIKLVWENDGYWLSSSFILSGIMEKSDHLLASLRTGI